MEIKVEQLFQIMEELAANNHLNQEQTEEVIRNAFVKTITTNHDPDADIEVVIEKPNKFMIINKTKLVVEKIEKPEYAITEISLEEAKKIDADVKLDDEIEQEVKLDTFTKRDIGKIRQLITQGAREKKKAAIYAKHKSLIGEMIKVTVTSSTATYAILELEDGTTAFMPSNLRNQNIPLAIGEKVEVYVEDVKEESKDSQIVVSNGSPTMIRRVLEAEVPEISEGIVEIVKISRQAGERAKVAVRSMNPEVDPVGAIIGERGSRISSIVKKLEGERIDIIKYSDDINEFVSNALAPAKVISVLPKRNDDGEIIDGHVIVITPNKHQTLAIGRRGINARLSVELVDCRIDVMSIDDAKEAGLEIIWNGNVEESQLAAIESGERVQRGRPRNGMSPQRKAIKTDDIELDITSFTETMGMEEEQPEEISYDIDDSMFSEDELKAMEANFDFDSEIEDFETDEEYEKSINEETD